MLDIKNKADLERIIHEGLTESLTLDYKGSEALDRRNPKVKPELCKDVSAFANSAGGQIIYGIPERNQVPQPLDAGTLRTDVTPEWIEEVISANVFPRIPGLHIAQIPISADGLRVAYVITIPQSISAAPHMALDHCYYRRYNFQSVAMEDYEVRDAMRRSTKPEPFIILKINDGQEINFPDHPDELGAFVLGGSISNRSSEPALYTIVNIFLDERLVVLSQGDFDTRLRIRLNNGQYVNRFTQKLGVPASFPIFKEVFFSLSESDFNVRIPDYNGSRHESYLIGHSVHTPGYNLETYGQLILEHRKLRLDFVE